MGVKKKGGGEKQVWVKKSGSKKNGGKKIVEVRKSGALTTRQTINNYLDYHVGMVGINDLINGGWWFGPGSSQHFLSLFPLVFCTGDRTTDLAEGGSEFQRGRGEKFCDHPGSNHRARGGDIFAKSPEKKLCEIIWQVYFYFFLSCSQKISWKVF